jgi:hypothetical protein
MAQRTADAVQYPLDLLQDVATHIMSDADAVKTAAATFVGQLKQVVGGLPGSVQGDLGDFIRALDVGVGQVMDARHTVGSRLNLVATGAAQADTRRATDFHDLQA